MRLLVTGGTGFVGAATVRALVAEGHRVTVLKRATSDSRRLAGLPLDWTGGDLRNPESLSRAIERTKPDGIVHLAWEGVGRAQRNDPTLIQPNVVATATLADAARRRGVEMFIALGSQAEYGPIAGKIDERTARRPTTAYGQGKLLASRAFAEGLSGSTIRALWLRLFPTYGPGDHPESLVASVAADLRRGVPPRLTSCEQTWDYLHVTDVATAIVLAVKSQRGEGVLNLASGMPVRLREVVETLRARIAPEVTPDYGALPSPRDGVMRLEVDPSRIQDALNWKPRIDLVRGLSSV